jgi:hypothetical protein
MDTNDSLNIRLNSKEKNLSFCIQYFTENDSNYIAILNEKFNQIDVFNIYSGRLVKAIEIKREGSNAFFTVMSFVMKNLDTVVAVSLLPQFIGIINGQGEVIKKISYEKDVKGEKIKPSFSLNGSKPFLIDNTLYLSQTQELNESNGILTSIKQKHSNMCATVNLITGECKLLPIIYPTGLIGKDLTGFLVCRTLGYKNRCVYYFGDSLYTTHDHITFEKNKIQSNYQFKFSENGWKYMSDLTGGMRYNLSRDEVQDFYYDGYRECYYLVVRQRTDDLGKSPDFRVKFVYPHCFIVILDKNLRYMGDVYFPDDTYSFKMMFITKKGLYISEDHVNNPSYNEDAMRFRLFTLKKI